MNIEVSNGELVDKVSILRVKLEKIWDTDKRICLTLELVGLESIVRQMGCYAELLELQDINGRLWNIIGEAKTLLERGELNKRFVELSADTIRLNNARFLIKKKIDHDTGSTIREVKEGL